LVNFWSISIPKKQNPLIIKGFACLNVIPKGFEPLTFALEGRCSIQLSYGTIISKFTTAIVTVTSAVAN
jgi:hypothetical protein